MLVKDVIDFLNSYAPLDYAEDFDNTGLIVGNKNDKVNGIIICLDATKEVVQEAIDSNKNLIISFHPIIFNGLKYLFSQRHSYEKKLLLPFFVIFLVEIFPLKTTGSFFTTTNSTFIFIIISFIVGLVELKNKTNDKK